MKRLLPIVAILWSVVAFAASEPVLHPVPQPAVQHPVILNPNHPVRYVVKKGDTLWDISGKFLEKPWQWPKLWRRNPQIKDPDLIYPGDVLVLRYEHGQPTLYKVAHAKRHSPSAITHPIPSHAIVKRPGTFKPVPPIALAEIQPFLDHTEIVGPHTLASSPYIVALDKQQIVASTGSTIYVRGIPASNTEKAFVIFKAGETYKDPQTKKPLGYAAIDLGTAKLIQNGDPATLEIMSSTREVDTGDRLLPVTAVKAPAEFYPRAPDYAVGGEIIASPTKATEMGQRDVAIINVGSDQHVTQGDVLAIYTRPRIVEDGFKNKDRKKEKVMIPGTRIGELMIFRTYPRLSMAIILRADKPAVINDIVTNP